MRKPCMPCSGDDYSRYPPAIAQVLREVDEVRRNPLDPATLTEEERSKILAVLRPIEHRAALKRAAEAGQP